MMHFYFVYLNPEFFQKICFLLGSEIVTVASMKMRLIALMVEAASTSETSVNLYQTTRCYDHDRRPLVSCVCKCSVSI
jgi:hypothetical protein